MDTNINIQQLKRQLNIEESYTSDDVILQQYLDVAEVAIQNYLGVNSLTGYTSTTLPISVEQAVIMYGSHLYLNRNIISYSQGYEIPLTFRFLLDYYKDFVIQ